MALKIEIVDEKGVKVRYIKINSISIHNGKAEVVLYGYVNLETRAAEKEAIEEAKLFEEYEKQLREMRESLDGLLNTAEAQEAQVAAQKENAEALVAAQTALASTKTEIIQLSEAINEMEAREDRPQDKEPLDTHYSEYTQVVEYVEPMTYDSVYTQIAALPEYEGAEKI